MIVHINVIGSAILYLKGGVWNVVFITDACHDVKFDDPDVPGGAVPLAKATVPRQITFSADATPSAILPSPAIVDQFLNMSASYMHNAPGGVSNLEVRPTPAAGRKYVHMTIPFGRLSVTSQTVADYFVELYHSGKPRSLGRRVASAFTITFAVTPPDGLTMTVTDTETGSQTFPYPRRPLLDLTFDNYCGEGGGDNDFINNYDWLFDKTSPDVNNPIRYVAGKILGIGIGPLHPSVTAPFFGPQGDCDPTIVEPPPG